MLVNIPSWFLVKIASDQDVENALNNYDLAKKFSGICIRHPISKTIYGKIATIFGYSVKGLLTLILDIISNVISLSAYRSFIRFKLMSLNLEHETKNKQILKLIELKNRKHTFMTFYLTLFSIFVHAFQFSADMLVFIFVPNQAILFLFTFLIIFICALKQIVNVLFFYYFNKNFRNCAKNLLKIN